MDDSIHLLDFRLTLIFYIVLSFEGYPGVLTILDTLEGLQ